VERDLSLRGSAALHAELEPELRAGVEPNDRKRIARVTELIRAGIEPARSSDRLWTTELRHPTLLVGLAMTRGELGERIDARVNEMVGSAAADEARRAAAAGASRTARAALGFEELLNGNPRAMQRAHRQYARRQLTWMRRMEDVVVVDRTARSDEDVATEIVDLLDRAESRSADGSAK
jgi:tRNA dimethylallyltransferase